MVTLGFVYLGVAAFSTAYSLALSRTYSGVPTAAVMLIDGGYMRGTSRWIVSEPNAEVSEP